MMSVASDPQFWRGCRTFRNFLHNVFGVRAAVRAETIHPHSRILQPVEHPFQRFLLLEADIGVPVPVLHAHNHVSDDRNARLVALEAFVGHVRVMFFGLYELVVEVKVIRPAFL